MPVDGWLDETGTSAAATDGCCCGRNKAAVAGHGQPQDQVGSPVEKAAPEKAPDAGRGKAAGCCG